MEHNPGTAIEGGPGWHIDVRTLKPVVDDLEEFRSAHRDDPALEALTLLWTGRPHDTETALRQTVSATSSPRLRALLAGAWRDQGRTAKAVKAYQQLVQETAGKAERTGC